MKIINKIIFISVFIITIFIFQICRVVGDGEITFEGETILVESGEVADLGESMGLDEYVITSEGGVDLKIKKNFRGEITGARVTFDGVDAEVTIEGNQFTNIRPQEETGNKLSYIDFDEYGKMSGANFRTGEDGGNYIIGNTNVQVPPNSQLIYDGKKITINVLSGEHMDFMPISFQSAEDFLGDDNLVRTSTLVEISGENVILPSGHTMSGTVYVDKGLLFVPKRSSVTIDAFEINTRSTPVELRFGSWSDYSEFGSESGNFVRLDNNHGFETCAKFQGTGFKVKVNSGGLGLDSGLENSERFVNLNVDGTILIQGNRAEDTLEIFSQGKSIITTGRTSFKVSNNGQIMRWVNRDGVNSPYTNMQIVAIDSSGKESSVMFQNEVGGVIDRPDYGPTHFRGLSGFGSGLNESSTRVDNFVRRASSEPLQMIDRVLSVAGVKQRSPHATEFLNHYFFGEGEDVNMNFPEEWQDWVIEQTKNRRPGTYELNPYNSGIYDLRNTMGHFQVTIQQEDDGTRVYECTDVYDFGYYSQDRSQQGRHGFALFDLSESTIDALNNYVIPSTEYDNPGGFVERLEVKKVGGETYLLIPRELLRQNGNGFNVRSVFTGNR